MLEYKLSTDNYAPGQFDETSRAFEEFQLDVTPYTHCRDLDEGIFGPDYIAKCDVPPHCRFWTIILETDCGM